MLAYLYTTTRKLWSHEMTYVVFDDINCFNSNHIDKLYDEVFYTAFLVINTHPGGKSKAQDKL